MDRHTRQVVSVRWLGDAMKTTSLSTALVVTSLLCGSCAVPPTEHLGGPTQVAARTSEVPLSSTTKAVLHAGSSYATRTNTATPAIDLKEGSLLLVKNKDGAQCQIMAGPATVQLIGTTVLTEKHHGVLRIIDVEGKTRVNWGLRAGEYRMLEAGQMLLVDEKAETLPGPVLVDLNRLVSKEELLASGFLSSEKLALIDHEVKKQADLIARRALQHSASPLLASGTTLETMQGQTAWNGSRMVDTRWDTAGSALNVVTPASPAATINAAVGILVTSTLR